MRSRSWVLWLTGGLALALAGGGAAWWVRNNVESYETEQDVGYRGAARLNPFLAAEFLLNEMGLPTVSRFQLGQLPAPDQTLVLFHQGAVLQTRLERSLLEWVSSGGHLVAVVDPNLPVPLLDLVGIAVKEREFPPLWAAPEEVGAAAEEAAPQCMPEQDRPEDLWTDDPGAPPEESRPVRRQAAQREVALVFPSHPTPLTVRTTSKWTLSNQHGGGLGCLDDHSSFCPFAQANWGAGLVTALLDPAFMTNRHIGELDHAEVAYELVQGAKQPARVVLVIHAAAPGLWQLLWQRAWMVWITAGFLLGLWVWLASRRLGPLQRRTPPRRRSLLEHIEATGIFLWRQGQGELLLESSRQAVRRRVASRLGTMPDQEEAGLEQAIIDQLGERPSLVRHAFHSTAGKERRGAARHHYLKTVQQLERLWSKR